MYLAKPRSTQSRIFHRRSVRRLLASWRPWPHRLGERTPNETVAVERDLHLKRVVDVFGAALGLALFSPVLFISGLLIRLTMGRPVLYVGPRPGLGGRIFRLYKFRTMTEERGPAGELLPDSDRLTVLGKLLRRFSIDELPTFWNVLRGDMSLVGPRPLLVQYLPYFTVREQKRQECRPGITGWAQIHGRNYASWDERLRHDVWYVENRCLWLDLGILLVTVGQAILGKGVAWHARYGMLDLDKERTCKSFASVSACGPALSQAAVPKAGQARKKGKVA